jgi:hypothetical protein
VSAPPLKSIPTFNPNTNKYEQCKPDKMKGGSGKELIIR